MTETQYEKTVNSLTGNLGPVNSAYWYDTNATTGNPWDLGAAPLYFSPSSNVYVTSYEANAAPMGIIEGPTSFGTYGTWDPSSAQQTKVEFGKRKNRKNRKSVKKSVKKTRKTRKHRGKSHKKSFGKRKYSFGCAGSCGIPPSTNLGFGERIA